MFLYSLTLDKLGTDSVVKYHNLSVQFVILTLVFTHHPGFLKSYQLIDFFLYLSLVPFSVLILTLVLLLILLPLFFLISKHRYCDVQWSHNDLKSRSIFLIIITQKRHKPHRCWFCFTPKQTVELQNQRLKWHVIYNSIQKNTPILSNRDIYAIT